MRPSRGSLFSPLAILLTSLSMVASGPTHHEESNSVPKHPPGSCEIVCPSSVKNWFQMGTTLEYKFTAEVGTSMIPSPTENETANNSPIHLLKIKGVVEFHAVSNCELVLQLKESSIGSPNAPDQVPPLPPNIQQAIEKHSLRFSYHNGEVEGLCPEKDEPTWVLNIKRGVISMLQTTVQNGEAKDSFVQQEKDVNGDCPTTYNVQRQGSTMTINKWKDVSHCTKRAHSISTLQSVPYDSDSDGKKKMSILSGFVSCQQIFQDDVIHNVACEENQTVQPLSGDTFKIGATNRIFQKLELLRVRPMQFSFANLDSPKSTWNMASLVYENDESIPLENEGSRMADIDQVRLLLKDFYTNVDPQVKNEAPRLFRNLVKKFRNLNEAELRELLAETRDNDVEKKNLLSIFPLVNTPSAISVFIGLYSKNETNDNLVETWLRTIAVTKYPSKEMISALMPLLEVQHKAKFLFSVTAAMHSHCKALMAKSTDDGNGCDSVESTSHGLLVDAIGKLSAPLGGTCEIDTDNGSSRHFRKVTSSRFKALIALKALGNLGFFNVHNKTLATVERCFLSKSNPVEVRIAAMDALRRLSCDSFHPDNVLDIFSNLEETAEVRIHAYLASMRCADKGTVETVEHVLENEVLNQVGSFVWTHLSNLQKTKRHDRKNIDLLLSNELLHTKFQTDARKFSRNFEASYYSNQYDVGGGLDANVIFTDESFLPTSVMGNLSLNFFGETVNMFEFGGRFTDPEDLFEPLFSPSGLFPDESIANIFKKRQKRATKSTPDGTLARIQSLRKMSAANEIDNSEEFEEDAERTPSGAFYMRIFGHELSYKDFHTTINDNTIVPVVLDEDGKRWLGLKTIVEVLNGGNKEAGHTRSNTLSDFDLSVPTMLGLPLTLSLHAGSTVSFSADGKFNLQKFMKTKQIELHGELRPNFVLTLDALFGVQVGKAEEDKIFHGISFQNVLASSTAIAARLEMSGTKEMKGVITLPQKRQDIVQVESKMVFLTSTLSPSKDEAKVSTEVTQQSIKHHCLGGSTLGLRLCGEVASTSSPSSHRASLYLEKTEEFNGYTFAYSFLPEVGSQSAQLKVLLDTPGSNVDRKVELNFVRNVGTGTFSALLRSPSNLLDASGVYSPNVKALYVNVNSENAELLRINSSLTISKTKDYIITPFLYLAIKNNPLAEFSGAIRLPMKNHRGSNKAAAEFSLKHITESPIHLKGNYIMRNETNQAIISIESYYLSGTLRGELKHRLGSYWIGRSALEYSWKQGPRNSVDMSGKFQVSKKGLMSRWTSGASLTIPMYPDYNMDLSWEAVTSPGFCENIAKVAIGKSLWEGKTLYSFQTGTDLTELKLLLALVNSRGQTSANSSAVEDVGVNYRLEFLHRMAIESIATQFIAKSHGVGNQISAKFQYDTLFRPFIKKNVTAELILPGNREYKGHSSLLEKKKGEFIAELLLSTNTNGDTSNASESREIKATVNYNNNSTNMKLQHLVDFRARGIFLNPISGSVEFSVTDRQSHVGCQVTLEGEHHPNRILSSSFDYSNLHSSHKIEAKLSDDETKYGGELVFGQSKSGLNHLSLDMSSLGKVGRSIFLEVKTSGSLQSEEGIACSLLFVPNTDRNGNLSSMQIAEFNGSLSSQNALAYANYFGNKFSIAANMESDDDVGPKRVVRGEVGWGYSSSEEDELNMITLFGNFSHFDLQSGYFLVNASTPFSGYKNMSLLWNHDLSSASSNYTFLGNIESNLEKGRLNLKMVGSASSLGYVKMKAEGGTKSAQYVMSVVGEKSHEKANLETSFQKDELTAILNFEVENSFNRISMEMDGGNLFSLPQAKILVQKTETALYSGTSCSTSLHAEWKSLDSDSKEDLEVRVERNFNPGVFTEYVVNTTLPWLGLWKNLEVHFHQNDIESVKQLQLKTLSSGLSFLPQEAVVRLQGDWHAFSHSAKLQLASKNEGSDADSNLWQCSLNGSLASLGDLTVIATATSPGHHFKFNLHSVAQEGVGNSSRGDDELEGAVVRKFSLITDIDDQVAHVGIAFKKQEESDMINEVTAWGKYPSGSEKRASMLFMHQDGSKSRKVLLSVMDNFQSLLRFDGDFNVESLQFWKINLTLNSNLSAIPSVLFQSTQTVTESQGTSSLLNYMSWSVQPMEMETVPSWLSFFPARASLNTSLSSNFTNLLTDLKWSFHGKDEHHIILSGEKTEGEYQFHITPHSSLFERIEGHFKYQTQENVHVEVVVTQGPSNTLLKGKMTLEDTYNNTDLLAELETQLSFMPTSVFKFSRNKELGRLESSLQIEDEFVYDLTTQFKLGGQEGIVKIGSASSYFPSIDELNFEVRYKFDLSQARNGEVFTKFQNGADLLYVLKGVGGWRADKLIISLSSEGEYVAGIKISLTDYQKLLASASYSGHHLGHIEMRYTKGLAPSYAWGQHNLSLAFSSPMGQEFEMSTSVKLDPGKFNFFLATPFDGWAAFELVGEIETQLATPPHRRSVKFGMYKGHQSLDLVLDWKLFKRNETTVFGMDTKIAGFEDLRQGLAEKLANFIAIDPTEFSRESQQTYSAYVKYSPQQVLEIQLQTPFNQCRQLRFSGTLQNSSKRGSKSLLVSTVLNENSLELVGNLRQRGKQTELDFKVMLPQEYQYEGEVRVDSPTCSMNLKGGTPLNSWSIKGEHFRDRSSLDMDNMPFVSMHSLHVDVKRRYESAVRHGGQFELILNNNFSKKLGYNFTREKTNSFFGLTSNIESWEGLNVTLDHDEGFNNIKLKGERNDGKSATIEVTKSLRGNIFSSLRNVSDSATNTALCNFVLKLHTPFREYESMLFAAQLNRSGGNYISNITYSKNGQEVLQLSGTIVHRQPNLVSLDAEMDARVLGQLVAKAKAMLTVESFNNASLSTFVEIGHEKKHEIHLAVDMSEETKAINVTSTLEFLRILLLSFRQDKQKSGTFVHASWERRDDQVLEFQCAVERGNGSAWDLGNVNISFISSFDNFPNILTQFDASASPTNAKAGLLFEDKYSRRVGRLEGSYPDGVLTGGRWKLQLNMPSKEYQNLMVNFKYGRTKEEKDVSFLVERNFEKLVELIANVITKESSQIEIRAQALAWKEEILSLNYTMKPFSLQTTLNLKERVLFKAYLEGLFSGNVIVMSNSTLPEEPFANVSWTADNGHLKFIFVSQGVQWLPRATVTSLRVKDAGKSINFNSFTQLHDGDLSRTWESFGESSSSEEIPASEIPNQPNTYSISITTKINPGIGYNAQLHLNAATNKVSTGVIVDVSPVPQGFLSANFTSVSRNPKTLRVSLMWEHDLNVTPKSMPHFLPTKGKVEGSFQGSKDNAKGNLGLQWGHSTSNFLNATMDLSPALFSLKATSSFQEMTDLAMTTTTLGTKFDVNVFINGEEIVKMDVNHTSHGVIPPRYSYSLTYSSPWTQERAELKGTLEQSESLLARCKTFLEYRGETSTLAMEIRNEPEVTVKVEAGVSPMHRNLLGFTIFNDGESTQRSRLKTWKLLATAYLTNWLPKGTKELEKRMLIILTPPNGKPLSIRGSLSRSLHGFSSFNGIVSVSMENGGQIDANLRYSRESEMKGVHFVIQKSNAESSPEFKYGITFWLDGTTDFLARFEYKKYELMLKWGLQLEDWNIVLRLALPTSFASLRKPRQLLDFSVAASGVFDPSQRSGAISINSKLNEKTFAASYFLSIPREVDSTDVLLSQGSLTASHAPGVNHEYKLHFKRRPATNGKWVLELNGTSGDFSLDLVADVTKRRNGVLCDATIKTTAGTLLASLDYVVRESTTHVLSVVLESPSLIKGKKVNVELAFARLQQGRVGIEANIQCRTAHHRHSSSFLIDVGAIWGLFSASSFKKPPEFTFSYHLNSPGFVPIDTMFFWTHEDAKFRTTIKSTIGSMSHNFEAFADLQQKGKFEGQLQMSSPLIPSSRFNAYLKSVGSLSKKEYSLVGLLVVSEKPWKWESELKWKSWKDAVVLLNVVTPLTSVNRVTAGLKSTADEIYAEILTPISSIPSFMFNVTGFHAFQTGNWTNWRPGFSVRLPSGRQYTAFSYYNSPGFSTHGKLHLHFDMGSQPFQSQRTESSELYELRAEISPLRFLANAMNETARIFFFYTIPPTTAGSNLIPSSTMEFYAEGKVQEHQLSFSTSGTIGNGSNMTFFVNYEALGSSSPAQLSIGLLSPFEGFNNLGIIFACDDFEKMGSGKRLKILVRNEVWKDGGSDGKATINADYYYAYKGFLDMKGEVNLEVLSSLVNIPPFHAELTTQVDNGFAGSVTTEVGSSKRGNVQISIARMSPDDNNVNMAVNGSCEFIFDEENWYSASLHSTLKRGQGTEFSITLNSCDQNIIEAEGIYLPQNDIIGGSGSLWTPWGSLQTQLKLEPISFLLFRNLSTTDDYLLLFSNTNVTLAMMFDEEKIVDVKLISNAQEALWAFEFLSPILTTASASFRLQNSLQTEASTNINFIGKVCLDLEDPVGTTMGATLSLMRNKSKDRSGNLVAVALYLGEMGYLDVHINHSRLTPTSHNQTVLLKWSSPSMDIVEGQMGYQFRRRHDAGDEYDDDNQFATHSKLYNTFIQVDLPWHRSLQLDAFSTVINNDGDGEDQTAITSNSYITWKWDALRNEDKVIGIKVQEEEKLGWGENPISKVSSYVEIINPSKPARPIVINVERTYRINTSTQGYHFQVIDVDIRNRKDVDSSEESDDNPLTFSARRTHPDWSNFSMVLKHSSTNFLVTLTGVKVPNTFDMPLGLTDQFVGVLGYMDISGKISSLTFTTTSFSHVGSLSSNLIFQNELNATEEILSIRLRDFSKVSCKFLGYRTEIDVDTKTIPHLNISASKNYGLDKTEIFGGYYHKRKILTQIVTSGKLRNGKAISTTDFHASSEITGQNLVVSKLYWDPKIFISEVQDSETNASKSTGSGTSLGNTLRRNIFQEVSLRWDQQISPTLNRTLQSAAHFMEEEGTIFYQEVEQIYQSLQNFYNDNRLYIKDFFESLSFFQETQEFIRNIFNSKWPLWKERLGSSYRVAWETLYKVFVNLEGHVESVTTQLWPSVLEGSEATVLGIWNDASVLLKSSLEKGWESIDSLLNVIQETLNIIEETSLGTAFFRRGIQLYKTYSEWIREIPLEQWIVNVKAWLHTKIWSSVGQYFQPIVEFFEEQTYLKSITDLFGCTSCAEYGSIITSAIQDAVHKVWSTLEIEERIKSLAKSCIKYVDNILSNYLPSPNVNYNWTQGYVYYNQSLTPLIEWTDFFHLPRISGSVFTATDDFYDLKKVANHYYEFLDTLEDWKPVFDLDLRNILPPFEGYAILAGDHHFVTFDKKYYQFSGDCSYVAMMDISRSDGFTLVVNYAIVGSHGGIGLGGQAQKKSYSVTTVGNDGMTKLIDIDVRDFKVSVNGRKVELPLELGHVYIRRHQTGLELLDKRGFSMTCSLKYSVCMVAVSGWKFGKLRGLLGTFDNEPSNDFVTPNGQVFTNVAHFAYSWKVGNGGGVGICKAKNYAKLDNTFSISPEPREETDDICYHLLLDKKSPLRPCFNTVNTNLFLEMCRYDVSRNQNSANKEVAACPVMNAYVTECQKRNIAVWLPPLCVTCRTEDGQTLTTGESATLETEGPISPPSSSDNVILLEASVFKCISSATLTQMVTTLDTALNSVGLVENRYAAVGFGGGKRPHIQTIASQVWAHSTLFKWSTFVNGTVGRNNQSTASSDLYDAVHYAADLGFRAGVSKNFIAVLCEDEGCGVTSGYADVLTLLVENDMKLHLVVAKEFVVKEGRNKDGLNSSLIYGMDMNGIYTARHHTLKPSEGSNTSLLGPPDLSLKRQIHIPKDLCTPLALESNGTRFAVRGGSGSSSGKRELDVWSRRLAQSSQPSSCQRCECAPDRFGTASLKCHQCVSPNLWKFIEEWKAFQKESNRTAEFIIGADQLQRVEDESKILLLDMEELALDFFDPQYGSGSEAGIIIN